MTLNHAIEVRILDEVHTPGRYWNCHEGLSEKLVMRVSFRNIYKPGQILPVTRTLRNNSSDHVRGKTLKRGAWWMNKCACTSK